MINHLNSVLLEGTIFTKPTLSTKGFCSFEIVSTKVYQTPEGQIGRQDLFVPILASGELAKSIATKLSEGMRVRLIGRLNQEDHRNHKGIQIYCNHLEYLLDQNVNSMEEET